MTACFSIDVDPVKSTVRIVLSGFFETAEILLFIETLQLEYRRLRCRTNQHCTVVDIRNLAIQSQSSIDAFSAVLSNPGYASKRIVFIVVAGLARAQINRAAAGCVAHFVATFEEADAWLQSFSTTTHLLEPVSQRQTAGRITGQAAATA